MSVNQALEELKSLQQKGKLAGSWLITGPYGVGKSTLVRRFAGLLLTGKDQEISFHQDLKWIERDFTEEEKRDIIKTLNAGKALDETVEKNRSRKQEITIDDIRGALQFLSLTAGNDQWRVLVIDPADDMNTAAANGLLKALEEPPAGTVIFLISHNAGKLLPTIRSRCRVLNLKPLSDFEMKNYIMETYPEVSCIDVMVQLSRGSIGKVNEIIKNKGIDLYQKVLSVLDAPVLDVSMVYQICESAVKETEKYALLKDLLLFYVLQLAKKADLSPDKCRRLLQLWEDMNQAFKDTDSLYLDKKNMLANVFFKIGHEK